MAVTATDVSDRLFNSANQGKYITVARTMAVQYLGAGAAKVGAVYNWHLGSRLRLQAAVAALAYRSEYPPLRPRKFVQS